MGNKQELSPRRSRASRKPWPECPGIEIYRCGHCGKLYQGMGYTAPTSPPTCCDAPMSRLEPRGVEAVADRLTVDYAIVGGFDQNAVQVFWESASQPEQPEWVLLQTYTGNCIKYLTVAKRPPVVFPLADEDAYVYCDRPVCQRCVFRCKRGFVAYLYFQEHGLLEMPLDKVSDYFLTAPNGKNSGG